MAQDLSLDPRLWLVESQIYTQIQQTLRELVMVGFTQATELVQTLHGPVHALWENLETDFSVFTQDSLRNQPMAFSVAFAKFNGQLATFTRLPCSLATDFLRIETSAVKAAVLDSVSGSLEFLQELLPRLLRERTLGLLDWVVSSSKHLPSTIHSVDDYVLQRNVLDEIHGCINEKQRRFENYSQMYALAATLELRVPKEDLNTLAEAQSHYQMLTDSILSAHCNNNKHVTLFRKEVDVLVPEFLQQVSKLEQHVLEDKFLCIDNVMAFSVKELEDYSLQCEELEATAARINNYERFLDRTLSRFYEIEAVRTQLDLRLSLWRALRDWRKLQQDWQGTVLSAVDVVLIRSRAAFFNRVVSHSKDSLPECSVVKELEGLIFALNEAMPIVESLRGPLEECHWASIREIIGEHFEVTKDFTLDDLMRLGIVPKRGAIQAVAVQAQQELELRGQLAELHRQWHEQELPVKSYKEHKDSHVLGDLEGLLSGLDESSAKVALILNSKHVAVVQDQATRWKANLSLMYDIIEEWGNYQGNWVHLEGIFGSPDIKKHLPTESSTFEADDKYFRQLMKRTAARPGVLRATIEVPGFLHELQKHNHSLSQLQKQLNKYLETKRRVFPRFYFLSDAELLSILVSGADPRQVQPHLNKCFDHITGLEFGNEKASAAEIYAIHSFEGEKLEFLRPLRTKGNVEEWLKSVQNAVGDALGKLMAQARDDLGEQDRNEWAKTHHAQVAVTVAQTAWCQGTEAALEVLAENPGAFEDWVIVNECQLEQLVALVRVPLSVLQRRTVVALVTADVHRRDVVTLLYTEEVDSAQDFLWQQQLRYYWDKDDRVYTMQNSAVFNYGYEYMGPTSRLVITPLTQRCWLTVTSLLNAKLGASLVGPAGTGKTESVKDLAKALGMQCVVFNCSAQVTYKTMARLFSGLVQQGAWGCLDEFNCIDVEVLSVIAQQLFDIQSALREEAKQVHFEGDWIDLSTHCAVFATMNSERTELPDNLKLRFRPVGMMVPDCAMIAEITLFAEGFSDSKGLSKKVSQLHNLSSLQLSQQTHYDFGVRTVKTVLTMACALKRTAPTSCEELLLLRAIRDTNIPKLTAADIILFEALLTDLFPHTCPSGPPATELHKEIAVCIDSLGLQSVKGLEEKTVQLFDHICARCGVILIGHAGSGKSTCLVVLQCAMNALRAQNSEDARFQSVDMQRLNPKSITVGELYGEVDPLTQDWRDGLAAKVIRAAAAEKNTTQKWIVFDGPLDSLWAEHLNTALDDNKVLCLASGERMKLRHEMRVLFEVQDLAYASPATVSRCGVVFFAAESNGWRPYVFSWLRTQCELKEQLEELFELTLAPSLKFKKTLSEQVIVHDIQAAQSVCAFLEVFLQRGVPEDRQRHLPAAFVFSVAWGLGGALLSESRERFSDFLKQLFSELVKLPVAGSLFDYSLTGKCFQHWSERVAELQFDPAVPAFAVLVPTVVTVAYQHMLCLLYNKNRPVFFTGAAGVGKSTILSSFISGQKGAAEAVLLHFSARTSSLRTQNAIEAKVERKSKGLYSAAGHKKLLVFIDDANMPEAEQCGAHPNSELLRQLLGNCGFYDRDKLNWKEIGNFILLAAATPARGELSPRFMRLFQVFSIPEPEEAILTRIFGSILSGFLDSGAPEAVRKLSGHTVEATISIYLGVKKTLKPSPSQFHYTFSLRDISKVFQGILMGAISSPEGLIKLWAHECARVFQDRLSSIPDRDWFTKLLAATASKSLGWAQSEGRILFSDLLSRSKAYEQITSRGELSKELYSKLAEFNSGSPRQLQLVFFEAAVEHVLRITRALRQPRGNLLLIGVGGSGKRSLTLLASFLRGHVSYELGPAFREDLKQMMRTAGVQGRELTLICSDAQTTHEDFWQDISSVLSTGELAGLFTTEQLSQIDCDLRQEMQLQDSTELLYSEFVQRVREKLHIVMCMSPVGDALRLRCRMAPSLLNCVTVNWFDEWPPEALLAVSQQFLSEVECPEHTKQGLSQLCVELHSSVLLVADKFFLEWHRKVYVTPQNYLDLLTFYTARLGLSTGLSAQNREKLRNGLNNLNSTNSAVNQLQQDLERMAPELDRHKERTHTSYKELETDKRETEGLQHTVKREKDLLEHQTAECKARAAEAEEELSRVTPAVHEALRALDALNPRDIADLKNSKNPSPTVKTVLEAVCVLLNEQQEPQSLLGRTDFLDRLKNFNKHEIPRPVLQRIRKYLKKPDFSPEAVGGTLRAAQALCMWVLAIGKYAGALKTVKPKNEKVKAMKTKLHADSQKVSHKEAELQAAQDKVAALQAQCRNTQDEMVQLGKNILLAQDRLKRGRTLIELLHEEGAHWERSLQALECVQQSTLGDVFLGAVCVAYLGPFTGEYRKDLLASCAAHCQALSIPCSEEFSLQRVLATPEQVQEWTLAGLPKDSVAVDNGIICMSSRRWPLLIDPQLQAQAWVKSLERTSLKVLKMRIVAVPDEESKKEAYHVLKALEQCMANGWVVLFEDIGEHLDPALDPLILKQVTSCSATGEKHIQLGDSAVGYDDHFRLYFTSKLANPHYLPEVANKVNIINFTVTAPALEEQLLAEAVKLENSKIEGQKRDLTIQVAADSKMLTELQNSVLQLLAESSEDILDDAVLVQKLQESKHKTVIISKRMEDSKVAKDGIDCIREKYRAIAVRGTVLYFTVLELAGIEPAYQYSLAYIIRLFNRTIKSTPNTSNPVHRVSDLTEAVTRNVFTDICRGLFTTHKLVFSFLLATAVKGHRVGTQKLYWELLLKGAGVTKKCPQENPDPHFISVSGWELLTALGRSAPALEHLTVSLAKDLVLWKEYASAANPYLATLPSGFSAHFNEFSELLLIRALRPDKLLLAFTEYVRAALSDFYTETPPVTLEQVYDDSDHRTPIIFVLAQGADPTRDLLSFAQDKGWGAELRILTLGQGQGPRAIEELQRAKLAGSWLLLQNCHLAGSWLTILERVVLKLQDDQSLSKSFRLFLTVAPMAQLPVTILQSGLKLAAEAPKGIKANLLKSYSGLTEADSMKPTEYRKLLFSLSLFHAVLQERVKFGPLGFNVHYEFNDFDLAIPRKYLKKSLEEQGEVPWNALVWFTGHINYGGRVTDDWDRVCLFSLLKKFFCPEVLAQENYAFSATGTYYSPSADAWEDLVRSWPSHDLPEIFGLHENADVICQTQESEKVLATILSVQSSDIATAQGQTSDEKVIEFAETVQDSLPALLDCTGHDLTRPLATILYHEVERFNSLLQTVHSSLEDTQKAVRGEIPMSQDLDNVYSAILNSEVPLQWKAVGYPSLKPLSSWVDDLKRRVDFMSDWLKRGEPTCYWLSGLFCPQSFITGTLLTYSRKNKTPFDSVGLSFNVTQRTVEDISTGAGNGVYVHGLFLEGARWDPDQGGVTEQLPGQLYSHMPVIHFLPTTEFIRNEECYSCPVYKTAMRAGTLSTAGYSSNFILAVDLPSGVSPERWALEGTAMLCQLSE